MSSSNCTRVPINLPSSQLSDLSIAHHSFSGTSLVSTDGPSTSSRTGMCVARHRKEFLSQQGPVIISFQHVTIGSLPDNVLLDIFDFYQEMIDLVMGWHRLVQVCRRWRYLVFALPRHLGLKLYCEAKTPVKEILDVWPSMQIFISDDLSFVRDTDNIIAALEHPDRVCHIHLHQLKSSLFERLATMMQEPFPVLRHLSLDCFPHAPSILPDTFLGGSAPCLDILHLSGIPFPALPKLLLSARDLVRLELYAVPRAGYISPEAMVTYLSALTNLELFTLKFESPSSCPDRGSQHPHLLTRVDLPALTKLEFYGIIEYSEDFLAQINTPVITATKIAFFNQDIQVFDIPQLFDFVSRTEAHHESPKRAQLYFGDREASLSVHRDYSPLHRDYFGGGFLRLGVVCEEFYCKMSFLVQICRQLLPLLSMERLEIVNDIYSRPPLRQYDVDYAQWLFEIFRPFVAVQSLHIDCLEGVIALVLQQLTGARLGVLEVLPALRSIFVRQGPAFLGTRPKAIEPFITARHLANRPVTVHWWEDEDEEDEDEDVR